MRTSRRVIILLVTAAVIGTTGVRARVDKAAPLDADVTTYYKLPDGRVITTTGHYYRNGRGQIREDSGSSGLIIDTKAHTVTMLNHATKHAQVMAVVDERPANAAPGALVAFGHGTHEGHQVTKSRGIGPNGDKYEIWTADDLGIPVMHRSESRNLVMTKTLKNISVREPDQSIFAVPKDYSVTTASIPSATSK